MSYVLNEDWAKVLKNNVDDDFKNKLFSFINNEYKTKTVYPPKEKIIAVGTKKEKVKKEEVKKEEVKKEPESSKEENNENKNNENKNDVNENVKDDVPKDDNSSDTIESEGDKEEPAQ